MLFSFLFVLMRPQSMMFSLLMCAGLQILKVVEVCRDLVHSRSLAAGTVSANDIGVIAAFRQQVLKLRLALRAAGLAGVNVGSVEDFQVSYLTRFKSVCLLL